MVLLPFDQISEIEKGRETLKRGHIQHPVLLVVMQRPRTLSEFTSLEHDN